MLSDPAAAAWAAAGHPSVDAPPPVRGRCGRCGAEGPTVTSSRIVSESFTGFDTWPFGTRRLCVPCAWAYSRPPRAVPATLLFEPDAQARYLRVDQAIGAIRRNGGSKIASPGIQRYGGLV